MNIILIGYRGTGKSTIAKIVASRLGWDSISTDAQIVHEAKLSIPDIVSRFGWDHFRALETAVCQKLIGQDQLVIDTGGGVILKAENVAALKTNGILIWLTASVATITQRIGGDTQRPSLTDGKTFVEEVEEVLRDRIPKYQAAADHTIATDQLSPEQVAEQLLSIIPLPK